MFITRECDYAVRVIRALGGEARLSVGEICERESITAPFAYKILKKLQKAELVKGYRGVHGGYSMAKS
ncbi:rrf2 family protein (putative transcriptional regulator), partial [gut metagenome]